MNDRIHRLLEVLDVNGKRIHTLLTRLTQCENTAEDLIQELFIRLSKSESFDRAHDATGYVVRAAMNLAFEWRRREKRTIQSASLVIEPASQDASPPEVLEAKEQCAQVLNALDRISDLGREVIVLHQLQGESYDSIASQTNKTPHQVRAICVKAIGRIRKLLNCSVSTKEESK